MEKLESGKLLYEQVVKRINDMIMQGLYKKGDLLPSEKELMEMMGVSRITIRESIRILNEAGVIHTQKGKGSYVEIDVDQLLRNGDTEEAYYKTFMESTDVRLLLEPEVARYVATHATQEDLDALNKCLYSTGNGNFHVLLMKSTHNSELERVFQQLISTEDAAPILALARPFEQKSVMAQIQKQHEQVYNAIRDRKSEFAYFYMLEHLQFIRDTYEHFFQIFYHGK